ncbi:PaaI family thioesterase [Actinomadura rudentiformis]|uniref:PaaI family thioesterase n=1 Tax=Actinomadura rudentiformis TaxID=359158 RepID=A0A6H9YIR1_9ACTN|nr:PaaI family thioesterase [Actinomadura rudentiformis]KAB2342446.1 PaaI family thioesterase [Actinomadura rudentiformis]
MTVTTEPKETKETTASRPAVVDPADRITAHHPTCFGCGGGNERGLAIRPAWEGEEMRFEHTPPPTAEGGPGITHGGYLSALADEVMSMVAAEQVGGPVMTRRMQADYQAPALVGIPLTVRSWVDEVRRRSVVVRLEATPRAPKQDDTAQDGTAQDGTAQDGTAQPCFEARGVFLEVPRELWVMAMEARKRGPDTIDWSKGDPSAFMRWQMNGGLQEIFKPGRLTAPLRVAVRFTDARPADWLVEADERELRTTPLTGDATGDPAHDRPGSWDARFHGTFQQWQRLIRGKAPLAELLSRPGTRAEGRQEALTELAVALDYRRFA